MRLLLTLIAAAVIAFAPVAAVARDLTEAETASLTKTMDAFNASMSAGDMTAIAKAIPPKALDYIAGSAGVTTEQLIAAMIEQMTQVMAQVTIETFVMDIAKAEHRELADGTPYLVIPTTTVINAGERGTMTEQSPTLALMDDGVWYLMRIADSQQIELLRGAYPAFAGVEFPASTTETKMP